ncbi:ribbon-helix-helix protein, CopG family [Limosilactobacillus reuteri]|uniref:ribbon-helix-helix protein, CopG family n=1 Tax=Limosilactobacillus reuteri TaxID=1598 RepID=UPI001C0ACAD1|nr:ribbon-helix-helix protein, CopG family [Limosilactobacillus reuteri]MCC4456438.1 ribbon-helix-helix protein, CopG family [Limosilactobacillus reuteri]MCC4465424.1 ribbon-helix-helix protein, CopG family [Limosilactobacillus reuteri]QWS03490.1 ribbon-helix-helix protein, CopG family [Limosilactobacillus reuteri]
MESMTLTIRLPIQLSNKLDLISKYLGMSKSNLIRVAILKYLDVTELNDFQETRTSSSNSKRINLSLTQFLYSIVKNKADNLNVTVNSLIIYGSEKIEKHYSSMLEELDLKN